MVTPLPPAELEPMPFGLVNSKTLVDESARWTAGFEQESIACNARVRLLDVCDTGTTETLVNPSGVTSLGQYKPFGVQATVECSTMGSMRTDWEDRARNALEACTSKAVEMEFWEGRIAQAVNDEAGDTINENRYLTDGGATDLTPSAGTAVKVRHGLALLEGALASVGCGTRGFIHVPVSIASVLPLKQDGDVLRTLMGNYVVAGTGYRGVGPGITDPAVGTEMWIYATGPVFVRLGDAEVSAEGNQNYDTRTNTVNVSAERMASVVWDGCAHFAVQVDLSLDYQ